MPDLLTSNYEFVKPEIGGSDNSWGDKWNSNLDAIDAKLKELADKITTDVRNAVRNELMPVGHVLMTTKEGNPFDWLGFGTWVPDSPGRTPVGVGIADGVEWTVNQTRGEANVQLTAAQMPQHRHLNDPPNFYSNYAGGHTPAIRAGNREIDGDGNDSDFVMRTYYNYTTTFSQAVPDHHHLNVPPNFWSDYAGSDTAHNNIQPSIGRYFWLRTA